MIPPPSLAENLLALVLVLPLPLWMAVQARRARLIPDGEFDRLRLGFYRGTLAFHLGTTGLILVLAAWAGRPAAALGLGWPPGQGAPLALALALGGMVFLALQMRQVRTSAAARSKVREKLAAQKAMARILPRGAAEERMFRLLAISAGFCEEVIWRGFLLAVLAFHFGLWTAAALSLAGFVAGHLYQENLRALAQVAGIGLILTALTLIGGTLWPAILLHAAIDLASGDSAGAARRDQAAPSVN